MTRYAKSRTHINLPHRSSIFLAGRRSCCTWSLNKLHLCWWLRELIPGLQWDHKAFWTCTFIPRVEGESIGKIMIIGHKMKDCSSWKQWSLDTGWNCSSWCQEVLGYLPQTWLRARGMSQGFFWQLCSRNEQPNHPLSQEFFLQLRDRGGGRREKSKSLRPTRSILCSSLDLDLEKKEASDSLYCIIRRNHILARSRSREEGKSDSLYCIRRRNHIARYRSTREEGSNLKWGGPIGIDAFL
jgi:hypothetical protein